MSYRSIRLLFAAFTLLAGYSQASEVVLDAGGFEKETVGQSPAGWKAFHDAKAPSIKAVRSGANGSRQSVRGERSESRGGCALWHGFNVPQQRMTIELSFAFSGASKRWLDICTHEPGGKDASQLDLCIQGGVLMQFDGRTRTWEEITRDIQPTLDPVKPVWHRLRAIVVAGQSGIVRDDVWVSYYETKCPLTIGKSAARNAIGPELSFGRVVGDYLDEQVLLIKPSQKK